MTSIKRVLTNAAVAALVGMATLATAGTASAYVACNREGDCWHTENRKFDRGLGIVIHPDDWYFHQRGGRPLRDYHEGRGYYRGRIWVQL